jgi:hypothetical protein
MAFFAIIVIAFVLIAAAVSANGKKTDEQKKVALDVIKRVPALLAERTATGPWYELDEFYRENFVDIKCSSCEIDLTWACNETGETEFADLHYKGGRTVVTFGKKRLFEGDAVQLLAYSYAAQTYNLANDRVPPEGTWAYRAHREQIASRGSISDACR